MSRVKWEPVWFKVILPSASSDYFHEDQSAGEPIPTNFSWSGFQSVAPHRWKRTTIHTHICHWVGTNHTLIAHKPGERRNHSQHVNQCPKKLILNLSSIYGTWKQHTWIARSAFRPRGSRSTPHMLLVLSGLVCCTGSPAATWGPVKFMINVNAQDVFLLLWFFFIIWLVLKDRTCLLS